MTTDFVNGWRVIAAGITIARKHEKTKVSWRCSLNSPHLQMGLFFQNGNAQKWLLNSHQLSSSSWIFCKFTTYYFQVVPANWYSIWHIFWHMVTFYLAFFVAFCLTSGAHLLALPVEVRQYPLRSGARGWGLALPTEIWSWRLMSGSAHCAHGLKFGS